MTSQSYKYKRWQYYDMVVSKLKNISKSVSKQIIDEWAWFCMSSKNRFKKSATKTSPNYLQYKIQKCWLLSWIHFTVIISVTTFECFKMQMVFNLAPVSLSNKKVNFYTCPRLTFLKKNATENDYKSISEPLDFKIFLGGHAPRPP